MSTEIQELKRLLRRNIKARLQTLAAHTAERRQLSRRTARCVMQTSIWREASSVLLFASLPDEIDTDLLIEAALQEGKELFLPKVVGNDLECCYYNPDTVAPGAFGIMEPTEAACRLQDLSKIELALVPGIAFTPQGARLGRGRGFYDRLLPMLSCPTFGLCFPCQVVQALPTEPWDCPLDGIFALDDKGIELLPAKP
jgi:5-formyltetrahydrofolate cyclo-ligase